MTSWNRREVALQPSLLTEASHESLHLAGSYLYFSQGCLCAARREEDEEKKLLVMHKRVHPVNEPGLRHRAAWPPT